MSSENEPANSAKKKAIPPNSVGDDSFLHFLVSLANKCDVGYGITLNVHGSIITGTMISAKLYFEKLTEQISNSSTGGPEQVVFDALTDLTRHIHQSIEEARLREGDVDDDYAEFIHLENLRIVSPSGSAVPATNDVLWRGKISAIDGFSFGSIRVN